MAEVTDGPADRERRLAAIDPDRAADHHSLLRRLFDAELQDRRQHAAGEFFENLYWCAFLLYCVGDVTDAPLLWQAKHLDFDTAIGFDWQYVLGAGVEPTLAHLRRTGHVDIADQLTTYLSADPDLHHWHQFRRAYFYPTTP